MFKLFRFVSKVFLFEKFLVFIGSKDFLLDESVEFKVVIYLILKWLREKDLFVLVWVLEM